MEIKQDGAGPEFVEAPFIEGEVVRVTYLHKVAFDDGVGGPSLRIQIRYEGGTLLPGPEIPVRLLPDVAKAALMLLDRPKD